MGLESIFMGSAFGFAFLGGFFVLFCFPQGWRIFHICQRNKVVFCFVFFSCLLSTFFARGHVGYSCLLIAYVHSRWDTLLCTLAATTET